MKDHVRGFGLFAFVPMPEIDGTLGRSNTRSTRSRTDGIGLNTSYGDKWVGHPDIRAR
jgi:hypothetical protein